VRFVADLLEKTERRDAAQILSGPLSEPLDFTSHREFVRETLRREVELSAVGPRFVHRSEESQDTLAYRQQVNADGSPSERVAAAWAFTPGTELAAGPPAVAARAA
jgi:hypothetical protein